MIGAGDDDEARESAKEGSVSNGRTERSAMGAAGDSATDVGVEFASDLVPEELSSSARASAWIGVVVVVGLGSGVEPKEGAGDGNGDWVYSVLSPLRRGVEPTRDVEGGVGAGSGEDISDWARLTSTLRFG